MSPRTRALVDGVCRVVEEEAGPADEKASFPVASLEALRESRLLGMLVGPEYDGPGASVAEMVDVSLALGRADMSVALVFAMHQQQALTLVQHAAPELQRQVLPELAAGTVYLGSVTTEPRTGSSLFESGSAAGLDGDCLVVDRSAPIVTGGTHADAFLITMRSAGADTPSQVDLIYARRDQVDVEVRGDWRPMGMRATESVPMHLRGTVPADQLIGGSGAFPDIAKTTFIPAAHIGWAAAWLGAAAGALSRALHELRSRTGDGRPTSELTLARLGSVRTQLDGVHAMLWHTVSVYRPGDPANSAPTFQSLVNSLKLIAAERCYAAVHELVEVMGLRHGYLAGSPLFLERTFRDLRSASLNFGDDRLRVANGALALLDTGVHLG